MNANQVSRSGEERRQKYVFFLEEVRRSGSERRKHGRTAEEAYAALRTSAKAQWKRIFGDSGT